MSNAVGARSLFMVRHVLISPQRKRTHRQGNAYPSLEHITSGLSASRSILFVSFVSYFLCQLVEQVPIHQRGLCYAAIVKLAHRYEFDLIHTIDPAKIVVAIDLQLQHQVCYLIIVSKFLGQTDL